MPLSGAQSTCRQESTSNEACWERDGLPFWRVSPQYPPPRPRTERGGPRPKFAVGGGGGDNIEKRRGGQLKHFEDSNGTQLEICS